MAEGRAHGAGIPVRTFWTSIWAAPVGKVIRSGDGSALMRDPELVGRIIEAVVKAVDVPVTVKFRKGWDGGNVNAVAFAQMCQQAGAAAIAVHGRTRVQMYARRADWDIIRDVKRAVTIPVIANGDIFSGADAAHILRYTGADLAMVGRGSSGDPWLFARGNAAIAGEPEPPLPLRERIEAALHQIEFAAEIKGERLACSRRAASFAGICAVCRTPMSTSRRSCTSRRSTICGASRAPSSATCGTDRRKARKPWTGTRNGASSLRCRHQRL